MHDVRTDGILPALLSLTLLLSVSSAVRAEQPKPPPAATGGILAEFYRGIPGGAVKDLTDNRAFPDSPTSSELLPAFEIASDDGNQFGTRVRGFLYPPATGNYTFWIASDDGGQLFLSTSDDPAQKQPICRVSGWTASRQWDSTPEQKSKPIPLTAGKAYYIEALQKQGDGGSNLAVAWKLPDGKDERPIPANRLSPAAKPRPAPPLHVTLNTPAPKLGAGFHKYPDGASVEGPGGVYKMSYLTFIPRKFQASQEKMPMLIFLCGNGHQGVDLEGILNEGPANYLMNDKNLRENFPFVAFFPQPPPDKRWDSGGIPAAVAALIPEIVKTHRVDPNRVYLTGLSMGGKGTWLVSQENPNLFAAVAPISAVAVRPERVGALFKNLPTWIICGADDGGFTEGSKQMYAMLKAAGDETMIEVREHEGHGVWGHYYDSLAFYNGLLKWTRKPAAAQAAAATQPTG